jgi:hypothetical protein
MTNVTAIHPRLRLKARDLTGQHQYRFTAPRDASMREVVGSLVQGMGLPERDSSGEPQIFHLYLDRQGRHLRPDESVGEALRDEDELTVHPDVQAG